MLFDGKRFPKVIVFDLDFTLWPCWIDTHIVPPISTPDGGQSIVDSKGRSFSFYAEVPLVLQELRREGILVAVASSTAAPEIAREMLNLLVLSPSGEKAEAFFDNLQILPGSKAKHVSRVKKQEGVDFSDMIFFDDELRNKNVERELGVMTYLVRDGVSFEVIHEAVREWRRRNGLEE